MTMTTKRAIVNDHGLIKNDPHLHHYLGKTVNVSRTYDNGMCRVWYETKTSVYAYTLPRENLDFIDEPEQERTPRSIAIKYALLGEIQRQIPTIYFYDTADADMWMNDDVPDWSDFQGDVKLADKFDIAKIVEAIEKAIDNV